MHPLRLKEIKDNLARSFLFKAPAVFVMEHQAISLLIHLNDDAMQYLHTEYIVVVYSPLKDGKGWKSFSSGYSTLLELHGNKDIQVTQ